MNHSFPVLVTVCLLFTAPVAPADDFGVKLTRPDSLEGWDYGPEPARGWTVEDGWLRGTAESSELISGFTAGDGELRFQWTVSGGGRLCVLLPEVPKGDGLRIALCEGEQCGAIFEGDKPLFAGAPIAAKPDGSAHSAMVRRRDGKLSVIVDDQRLAEIPVEAARRFGLGLRIETAEAAVGELRAAEPPGRRLIPEGADTLPQGEWTCYGSMEAWTVENGELVLKPGGGRYLRSEKEYGNFTLTFDYLMQEAGNSGFGIRTPRGGWPSGDGMEIQIYDNPRDDEHSHQTIYGNVLPIARADKPGEWNTVVIKAEGHMIHVWENDELIQSANTRFHPELKHRPLKGWIGPQDHGGWIRFRDLRVTEAPDGEGLAAWAQGARPSAAGMMIERIMNSESVSKRDGITSYVVEKTVSADSPGETVLAELEGPGSVVRIARNGDEGGLEFYFDAEETPRIACSPSGLWEVVPRLNEQQAPVVTSLQFAKSLRIVLKDAKAAEYRFDCVRFPNGLPVETYTGPRTSFPRTLGAAPLYRQHVMGWGVHREHDPALHLVAEPQALAPGERRVLAQVPGAGLVRWIKLRADDRLLVSDDLWLHARVDGEETPSISAPARFWFPAFASGKGKLNGYLFCHRRGPTILLGMPFGDGFELTAENRGDTRLEGIGGEVSVEQATAETRQEICSGGRIRGQFLDAAADSSEVFALAGPGRWIGLVWEPGEDRGMSLDRDGTTPAGWSSVSSAQFLGKDGEYRGVLSGRDGGIAWRYLLLAPVDYDQSLTMRAGAGPAGKRLVLYVAEPDSAGADSR